MKRVNFWMKRSGYIVSCVLALLMCSCLFSCTEELSEDLKATDVVFQSIGLNFPAHRIHGFMPVLSKTKIRLLMS